jgi:mycothiol synthase
MPTPETILDFHNDEGFTTMARIMDQTHFAGPDEILRASYTFRPATMDDLPDAIELAAACDRALIGASAVHETWFRVSWKSPYGNLETDSLVVEDAAGQMIAFAQVACRPPFDQARVTAKVHPAHRGADVGEELGRYLVGWGAEQARRLTSAAPADAHALAVTGVLAEDAYEAAIARSVGMRIARQFVRMEIPLDPAPPAPVLPEGVALRPVDDFDAEERAICMAVEDAFRDHWGHVDQPEDQVYEEWRRWLANDDRLDPSLWFIARDGEEIAGMSICWPKAEDDPTTGYIGILGVRRPWRGRGLGLALLRHSFAVFRERGHRAVALHADGENITGALRLYHKAGMTINRRFEHFEKELRPGRDLRVRTIDDIAK